MAETWTDDGERFLHIDYDERDVTEIAGEALRWLLKRAGFTQADPPSPPPTRRDGRIRLRAAARVTTPPAPESATNPSACEGEGS